MKKIKIIIAMLVCCMIISTPCQAAKIKITINKISIIRIQKGQKRQLYIKGYVTSKKIKWKSSNKKIATVSKKGVVTGKKGGNCIITATYKKKKYKAKIIVMTGQRVVYEKDYDPEDEVDRGNDFPTTAINAKNKTLYVGQSFPLKITGTKKKIKWSSDNNTVATVSSTGNVTAIQEGTATIKATFTSGSYIYEYTCNIDVISEWMSKENIETKYGIYYINSGNKIRLFTMDKSVEITDIPGTFDINTIYGTDVRYKFNGNTILFNLNDLNRHGLL